MITRPKPKNGFGVPPLLPFTHLEDLYELDRRILLWIYDQHELCGDDGFDVLKVHNDGLVTTQDA